MTDLQTAKSNLSEHTICLCKDGECIYDDSRGIAPMMNLIDSGTDLTGYSVADKIVGKAAALLFVKSGIKHVFARVLSEKGKKVFDNNGVFYEFITLTENVVNRAGTGICPMEMTVADIDDPESAYAALKEKLSSMAKPDSGALTD